MEGVVIIAETEKDLAVIKEFAVKNGYQYTVIDEQKIKLISKKGPRPYPSAEDRQLSVVNESEAVYATATEEEEKLIINVKNDDELQQIRKILADMNISF